MTISYEKEVAFQANRRRAGVEFIKIISDLWYDKSIEMVLFRNQLIDKNVSEIINLHEYAGEFVDKPISIFDSVEIAKVILSLDLPPSKLDIGKLTYEYHSKENKHNNANIKSCLSRRFKNVFHSFAIGFRNNIGCANG